ncbi:MAG: phenylalanine--tRNA ligase beta subunit-related protein [Anaerolineae bacterium]|jgi:DNA/RNA-binding domain of Phe-tRNA-synthetase-like protein|nr:phenylalanine--tRNA ligase beta subunit-related protein [Anaerolineae bacterium]
MNEFQYDPKILATFPQIQAGVIVIHDLQNGPSTPELQADVQATQQSKIQEIGQQPLSDLPSIAAWRQAFRKFGVDPTQYRNAAEALLRRITKKGDLLSINRLVDLGNLISVQYALPVAVFDLDKIHGAITVCFADGSEHFTDLGQSESEHPAAGEVIFLDHTRTVHARRWCWRQNLNSAAQSETTRALIVIEAQHEGGQSALAQAVPQLVKDLERYVGGTIEATFYNGN